MQLDADTVEDYGLDSRGFDANPYWPYTTENVAAGKRERVLYLVDQRGDRGLPADSVLGPLRPSLDALVTTGQLVLRGGVVRRPAGR